MKINHINLKFCPNKTSSIKVSITVLKKSYTNSSKAGIITALKLMIKNDYLNNKEDIKVANDDNPRAYFTFIVLIVNPRYIKKLNNTKYTYTKSNIN